MPFTNQNILDIIKEYKKDTDHRISRFEEKMDGCFTKLTDTIHESQKNQAVTQQEIKTHNQLITELKESNEKTAKLLTTVTVENVHLKNQNKSIIKSGKWIIGLLIPGIIALSVAAFSPHTEVIKEKVITKPASAAKIN